MICTNRSSLPPPIPQIPPPPILIPPSAHYPSLPPPNMPTKLGPPPARVPLLPGYTLPTSCSLYPPPKNNQVCRSPNWQSSTKPLPIPTRITQGQTSFSPPFPPPPFNFMTHRPPYSSAGCSSTMLRFRPPWPPPPMPRFDPSVPPPGYVPMKESPHKATVDEILAVVAAELRAIVKKDIHRRMIEIVAFKAFDQWWDDKEQAAKVGFDSYFSCSDGLCCADLYFHYHFNIIFIYIMLCTSRYPPHLLNQEEIKTSSSKRWSNA